MVMLFAITACSRDDTELSAGAILSLEGVLKDAPVVELPNGRKPPVNIRYGQELDPSTFVALIDGVDISTRFHPKPGTVEAVNIPFEDDSSQKLVIQAKSEQGASTHTISREVRFSEVGKKQVSFTRTLDEEEMAEFDAVMKKARELNIPLTERRTFLKKTWV
ncbi:hypothetical protein [Thiohalomonas denitrificans]|uniref:hypothetical protein n=1 Tax=Thiohalomonas denitrificans TaxID=415747 RepID=UPI0026F194E3|nr:hypothetical protein [Thiohalomonas denitrificans]